MLPGILANAGLSGEPVFFTDFFSSQHPARPSMNSPLNLARDISDCPQLHFRTSSLAFLRCEMNEPHNRVTQIDSC